MMKLTYKLALITILAHPTFVYADSEAAKNSSAVKAINSISELITNKKLSHLEVIPEEALIRVKGHSFQNYSKCLSTPAADELSEHIGNLIGTALKSDDSITLKITGHSNTPSASDQSTEAENNCIVNDDEYSLSYMRASSVRKALDLSSDFDIDTVGNGADEFLNEEDPSDLENNWVDIQFIAEPQY
jgi:hypothetical protein